jgi:hypothetical protein
MRSRYSLDPLPSQILTPLSESWRAFVDPLMNQRSSSATPAQSLPPLISRKNSKVAKQGTGVHRGSSSPHSGHDWRFYSPHAGATTWMGPLLAPKALNLIRRKKEESRSNPNPQMALNICTISCRDSGKVHHGCTLAEITGWIWY